MSVNQAFGVKVSVGFASGPLQGVVIVFSLVKFLIGAFSGLLQRQ